MSYATIEEAWGGLGKQVPKVAERPFVQKPAAIKQKPVPRAGITFDDGRKYVRAVYAQYGIKGIMELLGVDISKRLCGNGSGSNKVRQRVKSDWFDALTPEKMLLILACVFGAVFLLDGFSGTSATGSNSSPPPW
jgi:hypothetical protein